MKTSSLIAFVLVLVLVLVGCGSSDAGSASSSANATRSSAPAATGAPDDKPGNESWDALALACKFGLDVYTAPECK